MHASGTFLARGSAALLTLSTALGVAAVAADRTPSVDWRNVRGDAGGMRHSPLTQISRENVKQLQVAWTYHTGDAEPGAQDTIECTPIVVDGVMYITTVKSKVVALDAATGQAKWTFDPYSADAGWTTNAMNGVNRGVTYWKDEKTGRAASSTARPTAACSRSTPRPARSSMASPRKAFSTLRAGIADGPRHLEARLRRHFSARRLRRSRHRRLRGRRRARARRCPATSARSTRARARNAGASTPCRGPASSGTTRGKATVEGSRRRERVERPDRRRIARPRLRRPRFRGVRFLRRRSPRRQPVRQLHDRARRAHGRPEVALPDDAPRHLGHGFADAAGRW